MALYEMTWRFDTDTDAKAEEIVKMLRNVMRSLPGGAIKQLRLTKVMDDE